MTLDEAVAHLQNTIHRVSPEAIDLVLARLAELEDREPVTEWGVRFLDGEVNAYEDGKRDDAETEAVSYGGELVTRTVGPWTEVSA